MLCVHGELQHFVSVRYVRCKCWIDALTVHDLSQIVYAYVHAHAKLPSDVICE